MSDDFMPMNIEDDNNPNEPYSDNHDDTLSAIAEKATTSLAITGTSPAITGEPNSPVTLKDFNYSITLIDKKINALYEMSRYISNQQKEDSKSLKKLVALDELSEGFWNVSI